MYYIAQTLIYSTVMFYFVYFIDYYVLYILPLLFFFKRKQIQSHHKVLRLEIIS